MLAEYYRRRAAEYDKFYADPVRQQDLATLRGWLAARARGRHILEVACGTGYWTAIAAPVAASITATDINVEMLAVAADRLAGARVTLRQADAMALPPLTGPFDQGMAHLWWSHLLRQDRQAFLTGFAARLAPRAVLLMIDENLVPGVGAPVTRRDADDNTWQRRWLDDSGERFEIVKNYPTADELEDALAPLCNGIEILMLRHFWALKAVFR